MTTKTKTSSVIAFTLWSKERMAHTSVSERVARVETARIEREVRESRMMATASIRLHGKSWAEGISNKKIKEDASKPLNVLKI